jgi:tetratricopeptide (TPR) repeat protein
MNSLRSTLLTLALLAAALIVTFLVYRPGLSGLLLLDDVPQLEELIKQSATDPATLFRDFIISTSGPTGRPVSMATFIGNAIGYGPDIGWWKYTNVLIHLLNGLLVFWLTAVLFQASPRKTFVDPWAIAAIAAGIWLLHPLQVSTVLYTVQRMTQLSTLFVLAGLVAYAKGRLLHEHSVTTGWIIIGLGFLVFYPLAVLSKENALLFPVFCSLIEILLFQFRGPRAVEKQVKIFHGILLAGYFAAAILVLVNFSSLVLDRYETRDFTPTERVLTQFRVIVMYLAMLLVPIQRNMGFFHDDIAVSTSLLEPITTVLSAIFLSALIVAAILMRRTLPLFSFGVLFFFCAHSIESSVLGLELMYEHRNYLGSVGILIAALSVGEAATGHRRALGLLAGVLLIGFSLLTWQRSLIWSSPSVFYEYVYRVHPNSPRVNVNNANLFAATKDFQRAREFLEKVNPGIGREVHRLLLDCLEQKSVSEADITRAVQLEAGVADFYAISGAKFLVKEVLINECEAPKQDLIELLDHLLSLPNDSREGRIELLFAKASVLDSMGKIDAAVSEYLVAREYAQTDPLPLYLAAAILVKAGRLDEARDMLARAKEVGRNTRVRRTNIAEQVYSFLGIAYEHRGRFDDALALYSEASESMPSRSLFYLKSAKLLLDLQRYEEVKIVLNDIEKRDLEDLAEYEYALDRITSEVSQLPL